MVDIPRIPDQGVEKACRAFYNAAGVHWDTLSLGDQDTASASIRAALDAFLADSFPDLYAFARERVQAELEAARD